MEGRLAAIHRASTRTNTVLRAVLSLLYTAGCAVVAQGGEGVRGTHLHADGHPRGVNVGMGGELVQRGRLPQLRQPGLGARAGA